MIVNHSNEIIDDDIDEDINVILLSFESKHA